MPVTVGPGQIDLSVSMATTTQTSGWSISYQLVFCGGPHLLSPSLSPTLSHTTHIHTHTYTLFFPLPLSFSFSHSLSAMSLPRSLTYSLEPHPHLYSFSHPLATSIRALRFSSFHGFLRRKRQTLRTGVANLPLIAMIRFYSIILV